MEVKTNFSSCLQAIRNRDYWVFRNHWRIGCNLKQFHGLTWLTLTPIFYVISTPLTKPMLVTTASTSQIVVVQIHTTGNFRRAVKESLARGVYERFCTRRVTDAEVRAITTWKPRLVEMWRRLNNSTFWNGVSSLNFCRVSSWRYIALWY